MRREGDLIESGQWLNPEVELHIDRDTWKRLKKIYWFEIVVRVFTSPNHSKNLSCLSRIEDFFLTIIDDFTFFFWFFSFLFFL